MRVLQIFFSIKGANGLSTSENLLDENKTEISSIGGGSNYNSHYFLIICGSVLLLTATHLWRNNMKQDSKPVPSKNSTIYSMMTSCINWFGSTELQKLKEMNKVLKEYSQLVEQQNIRSEEMTGYMEDFQKDLLTQIRSNEIKLNAFFPAQGQGEVKTSHKESISIEGEGKYQQLQYMLDQYPNVPERILNSSVRKLDQLEQNISEVRETIKERTKHHENVELHFQQLINQLRKELAGEFEHVEDSHHRFSIWNGPI